MKVTFKTGSEANYGSTNGELFFASNTKQIMLNGIKYIPKKLSELTNDSGFITSITKSMVEGVLTGNITSHTHSYLPLSGGTLTGNLTCNGTITAATFNGSLNGTAANASKLATHSVTDLVYRTIYPANATGILIETNIAAATNKMVNVHIWGNSYAKTTPIDTYIQFYYKNNGEIVNCGCTHLGYNLGDVYVFIYKSLVHIWFDVSGTHYPTINAFVGTNEDGDISGTYNHITSLTKGSKPTSGISREKVITPKVNAFTDSNVAYASKLATPRKITIGSTYKSFDGSRDIEFALNSIITQSDTINVGTLNVAVNAEITGALNVSGGDISGELANKLNITLGSTTTTYDNTDNKSITITPSTIGAAEASHTHSYLPLSGGTMSNTNLVTNLNADMLDGYHASNLVKFYLSPMSSGAPADSAKSWFKNTMPAGTGAIVYNVPGSEKTIIAGKSTGGAYGHMLQLNYDDNYLRILRCWNNHWETTDWEKISAGYADVAGKWSNSRTITLTGSVTGSVSIDGSANVSLATTTNHTHSEYLPLTGGTLNGALTVPTLTSTGGIVLGAESINGSLGIKKYNEGFIGFSDIPGGINGSAPFAGISLGWDIGPETSANSVRINASTFTYKGNSVLHSGNLGYTSSGLSRAVQKDASGNLFIVAPSLFEQGISNNYPKNLRWSNETEGQLVYDTEETAGNTTTVEVSIPVANGTSKGFLKSTSTVTNVTGYTPCPVVSGTPYYKEDCLYLVSTEIGFDISFDMDFGVNHTYNFGGTHEYLANYTHETLPRCVVLCIGSRDAFRRILFWLEFFDDENPYIANFYNVAYKTWLTIDVPSRQIILVYDNIA